MLYVFYCRKYFCKYVESIKYLLNSAFFDDGARKKKEIKNNNVHNDVLTKCGCAIDVHLQLDLLKFYLAILGKRKQKKAQLVWFLRGARFLESKPCRKHVR